MLLAVGKSVFHSLAARFTVLGFLGVQRTHDSSEPSRPAPWTSQWEPSAAELWEALQSTVASQGSCFPVLLSLPVSVRVMGQSPPSFPLRNENHSIPQRGEFPSAFLLLLLFLKIQTAPSAPCFRFLTLATTELQLLGQLVPSSGVHCCCCRWHFLLPDPTPPEFSDRAQDCGVRPSSRQCPLQSLRPSAALASQCPHWCRSFLYCKETYLRLLIAVWFGVFLQTPFVLWGP